MAGREQTSVVHSALSFVWSKTTLRRWFHRATATIPADRIAAFMQGNCTAAPPAALLSAEDAAVWQPGQCVIVIDSYFLQVMYSSVWLDSLFVSLQRTDRTGVITAAALITVGDNNAVMADTDAASGALWLTRSVVSGDTDVVGTSDVRNSVTALSVQRGSSAALHGVL